MNTYILVDKKPVREPDILKWGAWFESADRQIALDTVGEAKVSTVFLGVACEQRDGLPLLYETMVFGGPYDDETRRYSNEEDALSGHKDVCDLLRAL